MIRAFAPEETNLRSTAVRSPNIAVSGTRLEEADIAIAENLGRRRNDPLVRAAGALSEIADQPPALTVCAAVFAAAIKSAIKSVVARTRPHVLLEEGRYEVKPGGPDDGDWHSFPSGHTADAVAMTRALVRVFPASAGPAYGAAAIISGVQIPRGKHYPLDVLGGAAVGALSEWFVDWGAQWALKDRLPTGDGAMG